MTSTSSAIDADRAVVEATVPRHADGAPAVSEELWALHIAWRRTGSEALQDELFRCYQYLADEAAERLAGDGGHVARLRRAAYEALLTALYHFDPDRSVPFTAFAMPRIVATLRRHQRGHGLHLAGLARRNG